MSETYKIKFDRRGLPGSQQSRITKPYTLEDLHQMFSAYMTEGLIVDLSPREVKLVETAAGALERLKKVEAGQEDGVGEQGNPLLDRANATIGRLTEERDGVCARQDEEIGRWQQAIYELCCKAVEGLRETKTIDGAGCDSGDPLDLTLTEIGQAINGLRDEIDLLTREYGKAVEDFGGLYLNFKKIERERDEVRTEVERLEEWAAGRECANPVEVGQVQQPCGVCVPCLTLRKQQQTGDDSDGQITVRESCKRRLPLGGVDAETLEHALTITERERDKARMDLVGVRQDVKRMEEAWRRAETEIGWVRKERDKTREELLRARDGIDEALVMNGEIARLKTELLEARVALEVNET